MSKETDVFLSNEAIKIFIDMAKTYPNNMELGSHVRTFLHGIEANNQIKLEFPDKNLDN